MWLFQATGRLKIGTYTGPLQHGIVYSGGAGSLSFCLVHSCTAFGMLLVWILLSEQIPLFLPA